MSIVELSFAGFVLVGLLGIIGIVVIVTGRGPKNLNWKKNVEKKALKEDKSATNFLEPDLPKGETETIIDEEEEQEVSTDGAVKLEEKVIYEELSEEEIGINRRQFLTKALRISFGAFAGIQLISYLGFIWPKVSGGFGSKIDAGSIEEIKNQIFQAEDGIRDHAQSRGLGDVYKRQGVLFRGPGWNWTYPWIDGIWFDDLLDWIHFE